MNPRSDHVTFLFTDIEGSTGLWEQEPLRMPHALARHDALAHAATEGHHGVVVKMIGDGMHAAFDDPLDALRAALQFQLALSDETATHGIALRARCGLHTGAVERRDNDFFGTTVNRAARIMDAAHGGQVLLSDAVVHGIGERLPPDVSVRDLGSVRLRGLAAAERVYQLVHPQLRREFPALRSLEATPNNLPQQVTSYVGHERGLADVKKLLHASPLLTLLGMGGLGKTRMSLQIAADVMDDFPDGVWFVELASVADARLVPQAVASVLGVMEEAGRPVLEALVKFVGDRKLLVILDNCEHLVHACADLARALLQAGSRLKLLASSRENLHIPGEATYPVPALALPDAGGADSVDAVLASEAARLFVDRALAVQPAFAVTARNARAVAEICRRLDGIPLAIELAAARVRSLSVEMIAERLNDRFRLLTRGSRTALPRQQTLRALIDWSFDLLGDAEKTLFTRLAVFAGGFTLDACESVGSGGSIESGDVLDLVGALVDKSLVEIDASGARYRLLETVRQYAAERLDASGEADALRTGHLDFFVGLAERVRPELWGPDQGTWLARLDVERENFLSAHSWCDRAEHGAGQGLRLVFALQLYWLPRGLIELGYRVTVEALAREGAKARTVERSGALYAASQLAYFMGAYASAKMHGEECLDIARAFGIRERATAALLILGYACDALDERASGQAYFEQSAALARELGDDERRSFALNALAGHYAEDHDLAGAQALFEESIELSRKLGDRESLAIVLPNFARIVIELDRAEHARLLLAEALAIAREIGSRRAKQNLIDVAAGLAVLRGEWTLAARFFGAVETQMVEMALRRTPVDEVFLSAQVAKARSQLGEAEFAAEEVRGRALSLDQAMDEVEAWLASGAGPGAASTSPSRSSTRA